jgi:hypothetical protein
MRDIEFWGIDFSGAKDAGRKIWLCRLSARPQLKVAELLRCDQLPGSGVARETALASLCKYLQGRKDAVCGFDFPFSLPRCAIREPSWRAWVESTRSFAEADGFRAEMLARSGGRELRRYTDAEARTPFAPLNLRLYRQTFHGVRDVLAPLLRVGSRALPFDGFDGHAACAGAPVLMEVCPASTLKREGLYVPYKGRGQELRQARVTILQALNVQFALSLSSAMQRRAVEDCEGDALDAVIAAVAAWCGWRVGHNREARWAPEEQQWEGHVYA